MPGSETEARRRLGAALVDRRMDMDARYRNRELFVRERNAGLFPGGTPGISSRTVYDIERAKRANFDTTTKTTIEMVYALRRGAIDRALEAGGEITADDAPRFAPAPVTAASAVSVLRHLSGAPGSDDVDVDAMEDLIDFIEDLRARTEFRRQWRTVWKPAIEQARREQARLDDDHGAADGAGT